MTDRLHAVDALRAAFPDVAAVDGPDLPSGGRAPDASEPVLLKQRLIVAAHLAADLDQFAPELIRLICEDRQWRFEGARPLRRRVARGREPRSARPGPG